MTMNSGKLDKTTDSPSDMIAHMAEPKPMVIDVLTRIPKKFNLQMPEGALDLQIESICEFVMVHFKTVSPDEIEDAFTLNAAGKYPKDIYIKYFDLHTVGSILKAYKEWKQINRPKSAPLDSPLDPKAELNHDWRQFKTSGDLFKITRYIDEKWDYLTNKIEGFDGTIDEKKIDLYEKEYEKSKSGVAEVMAKLTGKPPDFRLYALNKYKGDRIKEYILGLINAPEK